MYTSIYEKHIFALQCKDRGAFAVVVDSYVKEEEGTGVVHQAPYFGAVSMSYKSVTLIWFQRTARLSSYWGVSVRVTGIKQFFHLLPINLMIPGTIDSNEFLHSLVPFVCKLKILGVPWCGYCCSMGNELIAMSSEHLAFFEVWFYSFEKKSPVVLIDEMGFEWKFWLVTAVLLSTLPLFSVSISLLIGLFEDENMLGLLLYWDFISWCERILLYSIFFFSPLLSFPSVYSSEA